VQGDDNAMAHTNKKRIDWVRGMAEFGFESEALYRREIHEIEFCSSRIYSTSEGPCFGPKPGKVLAKFGYIADPPKNVTRESMMRGVALGLEKQVNFIPVLRALVKQILKLTSQHEAHFHNNWFNKDDHKMRVNEFYHATDTTTFEMFEQYLWSPSDEINFERELNDMQLGDGWSFYTLVSLCDRDTSAVKLLF